MATTGTYPKPRQQTEDSGSFSALASIVCLFALAVFVTACTGKTPTGAEGDVKPRSERAPGAMDIVLVTVDTERADFTMPNGEKKETTPFLAQLAAQGITFTNAFSTAPWTVPAMYSIITGLYPRVHDLTTGQTMGKEVIGQKVLPGSAVTLTEILAKNGYSTYGINTNYHMSKRFGFAQGFGHYYGDDFAFLPFPNLMVNSLTESIRAQPKYFLWLHYFDPHFPYVTQSPWFGQWNDSKFRTISDLTTDITLKLYRHRRRLGPNAPAIPDEVSYVSRFADFLMFRSIFIFRGLPMVKPLVSEDYIRFLVAAYKSNIRQTDEAMKEALSTLGVDDQTLVIVTADHGEELFDHGELGHRKNASLHQELIGVPLVVRLPGHKRAGTVVDTPVSLIDIFPTILELAGLEVPGNISGRSLVPLINGKEIPKRPLFAEVSSKAGEASSIIEYPWKYVYNLADRKSQIYDLSADPTERNNLVEPEKNRALIMHKRLEKWVRTTKPRWEAVKIPLSQMEIRRLKQMGYMN